MIISSIIADHLFLTDCQNVALLFICMDYKVYLFVFKYNMNKILIWGTHEVTCAEENSFKNALLHGNTETTALI